MVFLVFHSSSSFFLSLIKLFPQIPFARCVFAISKSTNKLLECDCGHRVFFNRRLFSSQRTLLNGVVLVSGGVRSPWRIPGLNLL